MMALTTEVAVIFSFASWNCVFWLVVSFVSEG